MTNVREFLLEEIRDTSFNLNFLVHMNPLWAYDVLGLKIRDSASTATTHLPVGKVPKDKSHAKQLHPIICSKQCPALANRDFACLADEVKVP